MPTRREALSATVALTGTALISPLLSEAAFARQDANTQGAKPSAAGGTAGPVAASLSDFEPMARERMSAMAYEYVAGGAGDEITLRGNRGTYEAIELRTRLLVDVSKLDTSVSLLGDKLPFPILVAPTAYHRLVHPEGELATVRGAHAAAATMVVSSFATTAVEDIARAAPAHLWFQLYVQKDRDFTRDLVRRAEAAGCRALCVTVDTPVLGTRNRETRIGFTLPAGVERVHLKPLAGTAATASHRPAEREIYSAVLDPSLTWKDIEMLRSFARTPVLVKGVLTADDAERAIEAGVAGIIVSNHGGRNLDTAPPTIRALPDIVERVQGRIPVLVDGGIRRGTDVVKAIALGASAVLIGRPCLYGLAVSGAAGVQRVIDILRTEFEMAMALCGRTTVAAIDRTVLWDRTAIFSRQG